MSDGVHDNLDPEYNGKASPKEAVEEMVKAGVPGAEKLLENVPADWDQEGAALAEIKSKYLEHKLTQIAGTAKNETPPKSISKALVEHSFNLGTNRREFLEKGGKKEPEDHVKYPGKMDHISCAEIKL